MKQTYIIKQHHSHLLLFFAGWGMDEHPFQAYSPCDCDWMICYDYRSLDFDVAALRAYSSISVIAWSMGVWVAGHILTLHPELPVSSSLAINGTPFPIDEQRGIAPLIFHGTLEGCNERNLMKFNRRMCGSQGYSLFQQRAPQRPAEELKEELACMEQHYQKNGPALYAWEQALVGTLDMIFPADHQQNAWEALNVPVQVFEIPHYEESLFAKIFSEKKGYETCE